MVRFAGVDEAIAAIGDGATVATDGFTMMGVAEEIFAGIEASFLRTGHPRDLVVVHASGQSNRSQGFEHFANTGLVRRIVGSHWGLMPRMSEFLGRDEAEAVCLPQGQISNLYRAIASGRPGTLTPIGLGTFIDPRLQGGKINRSARDNAPDYVELVRLGERDYMLYKAFPIDVAIIRATTVDEDGNCSQEEEAVILDALAIAQAARNSGGLVICQAKRRVSGGTIPPKQVVVPACLVDLVVIASDPERQHRQTDAAAFDPVYLAVRDAAPDRRSPPARFSSRLAIGRRAVRFLRPRDVVNIGTGIPGDTVGPALDEAGLMSEVTLTVESGVYGGVPAGGIDFGIAAHPAAIIPHPSQFDFYDGGGLDATFMGAGEIDRTGNVNVSLLGDRVIGCGGFVDITQTAKLVVFCFSMEGKHPKFVPEVGHLTFAADQARRNGQEVLYVSERAVFRLHPDGLALEELAPGVSAQEVLAMIPFPVRVADPLLRMPADIFDSVVQPFTLGGAVS